MKNLFTCTKMILKTLSVMAVFVIGFTGCETKPDPSAYDPNFKGDATPVITALTPASEGFAGVTTVTITGQNFSPVPSQNIVQFDTYTATVLEATSTTLKVLPPNVVQADMPVRVATLGAVNWGYYAQKFSLKAAALEFGGFKPNNELPYAIATDAAGNIYASVVAFNVGVGIWKILPDGTHTTFAPKGGETSWSSLKVGPNGDLYGARNVKAVFQIQAGKAGTTFASSGLGTIYEIDFDKNKNIWAGGNNDFLYSITPAKVVKSFAINPKSNIRAIKVFATGGKDYVYFAGKVDTSEKVFRMEIKTAAADQVGTIEEVFNFSEKFPGFQISALTFAQDGDMIIGTDHSNAIVIVHPDKTFEPLFKGVIYPKAQAFAWAGSTLYYSRARVDTTQTLIKVNIGKQGAPSYGGL